MMIDRLEGNSELKTSVRLMLEMCIRDRVSFMPMLMDTAGNCGNQISTLMVRGLAPVSYTHLRLSIQN